MTVFTAFPTLQFEIYNDNVDDSPFSSVAPCKWPDDEIRHDTLYYLADRFQILDTDAPRTLTLPSLLSTDWVQGYLLVDGEIQLEITGTAYDNSTAIASYHRGYGNAVFPGFLVLASYNLVNSFLVRGINPVSNVDVYLSTICASTDPRITVNTD